jgi:hypothetical protein
MTRTCFVLSLCIAACTASSGWAQELVKPNGPLPLREAPPGGFFQGKGQEKGSLLPSDKFLVLEKRVVQTITGKENWWRVRSVGGPAKEGWVFSGPTNSNFSPAQ